jgi:hypothetical protein
VTYSQLQQQQAPYRPNRAALWVNTRKNAANQPDYKGNLEISWALFQELTAAFNAGQYVQDRGGQPCIKLDLALYAQDGGPSAGGKSKPIMSGQLSTVAETMESAAARQQAAQQYQPQMPPQHPQGYAPMPQAQPQPAYQQPPQPVYAPQQPAYQQPPAAAPVAPASMPQPQPAYQQPPQPQAPAPVAPPAPAQPMPGAIHGAQWSQAASANAPAFPQNF